MVAKHIVDVNSQELHLQIIVVELHLQMVEQM